MIHRVDRVNPDVDDRVIKPNEARNAVNLRFGASTDDTNLSGGTLILGNKKITSFTPPAGDNQVVGVYADLESRNVYFAMYNSQSNHAIYRISTDPVTQEDIVKAIVQGDWLNLKSNDNPEYALYNVSMAAVDGKLYWTDNVNDPRMVNIEKGIRTQENPAEPDVYPSAPVLDWFYSQIKRPPGVVLEVFPPLTPEEMSITFGNKTTTNTGLQYSYYYVYDNNEESRLAPYTQNIYTIYDVTIRIPNDEYNTYTSQSSLIKKVVIVVRNGNDGVWRELIYNDNVTDPKQSWTLRNVLTSIKNTVASDITDARFDSVPLLSVTNEIAQNKLNHGNYLLDYPYDNNISVEAEINNISEFLRQDPNAVISDYFYTYNSFVPWGRYTIGVELVDKFGRTYPVTNAVDVVAPWLTQSLTTRSSSDINIPFGGGVISGAGETYPNGQGVVLDRNGSNLFDTQVEIYDQADKNNTVARYKIKGALPDWVDRVNIVRSKAKNIITMHQSVGEMFIWYQTETQSPRYVSWVYPGLTNYKISVNDRTKDVNQIYNADESNSKLTFAGFAIKMYDAPPIVQGDNLFITIYPQYNTNKQYEEGSTNLDLTQSMINPDAWATDAGRLCRVLKFKIHRIEGDLIYIRQLDNIEAHPNYLNELGTRSGRRYLTPWSFPVAVYDKAVNSVASTNDPASWYPLLYNFTVTQEGNVDEQIVYTTQATYSRSEFLQMQSGNVNNEVVGYLKGDAAVARVLKQFPQTANDIQCYRFPDGSGDDEPVLGNLTLRVPTFGWFGNMISMSPRDIYAQEWNQDIGQINTVNYKDVQNRRLPSNICFSGSIIQGTQVNGLNKFNSLDFRQAPAENGPLTALVTTNATQREPGVLLAIGSFGISSFYYDAIQLQNVDGTNNVTTTDSYLASQRPLVGQFGTARQMSVTKTPLGTVYWWSDVVNDMIRYSNAGMERLGLTYSFGNFLRKTYNDNPLLITWYDQVTDEINLLGKGKNTSVFSERFKTFQGQREYWKLGPLGNEYPQRAIGLPTKQYWFINGEIYVADVEASTISVPQNFIFDVFKDPSVELVTNESPAVVKRWNQVKVFGNRPTQVNLVAPIDSGTELISSISPNYFIQRKGDWEAAIRRAENTTGGLLGGKLMESRIIYSNFAFKADGFDKLNFIEVKSNVSIVQ